MAFAMERPTLHPLSARRGARHAGSMLPELALVAAVMCVMVSLLSAAFVHRPTGLRARPWMRPRATGPIANPASFVILEAALAADAGTAANFNSQVATGREGWKRELLKIASGGNRGFSAQGAVKARMLELVESLEASFDAPRSRNAQRAALEGSWSVAFTTSADLTTLERLPLPFWRTGRIGQAFEATGDARNEIDLVSPLGSRINQTVRCTWKLTEPATDEMKVDLTFVGSTTKLVNLLGLKLPVRVPPLSLPLLPGTGVFKVSFLDEDLLVQRTSMSGREVNVLVRDARVDTGRD